MFDKDITIVNKWFNKETRTNEYKINHVKGFWNSNKGISLSDTLLIKNDSISVRILMSEKGYVSPKDFQETGEGWTLQNDDYLIKGLVNSITTIASLKDNYECMKITNIAENDYGSIEMQHFKVSGE